MKLPESVWKSSTSKAKLRTLLDWQPDVYEFNV